MKILHLTIKKKWFDMIPDIKSEEYREIKNYWIKRFKNFNYDAIQFTNGGYHGKDLPWKLIESNGILTGIGETKWGAPEDKKVFILKLGKLISKGNIT